MRPLFKNRTYLLSQFIHIVKHKEDRSKSYSPLYNYAIYAIDDSIRADLKIYVGDPIEVNDNEEEIYPIAATAANMWYLCSDENIQDVVDLAVHQNDKVSADQLITALAYYLEYDNFINF